MTAIVAYTDGTTIWMAGDSFCGDDYTKNKCQSAKVYKIGNLGVGLCGNVRQELVLESILRSTPHDQFTENWLRFELPDLLQDALKSRGAIVEKEGQSTLGESSYIFGLNGKLFYMEEDFGIWEPKKSIAGIGSGKAYALGALSTMMKDVESDPIRSLKKALKIASEWSPWVVKPFKSIVVSPLENEDL